MVQRGISLHLFESVGIAGDDFRRAVDEWCKKGKGEMCGAESNYRWGQKKEGEGKS